MGKRSRSSVSAEPVPPPEPDFVYEIPVARPDESCEDAARRLTQLLAARAIPSAKLGLPDDAVAPYVNFRLGAFGVKTAAGQIGTVLGEDAVTAEVAIEFLARG